MKNQLTGRRGEDEAAQFLRGKGYTILKKNYRFRHLEIDIIAQKDSALIFIEVKTRSSDHFGFPEQALTRKQEKNIIESADHYVISRNWKGDVRFDVIAILTQQRDLDKRIVHIEDAFWPFF